MGKCIDECELTWAVSARKGGEFLSRCNRSEPVRIRKQQSDDMVRRCLIMAEKLSFVNIKCLVLNLVINSGTKVPITTILNMYQIHYQHQIQ
jgi:hypothetical protein